MSTQSTQLKCFTVCALVLAISACASNEAYQSSGMTQEELDQREAAFAERERAVSQRESQLATRKPVSNEDKLLASAGNTLLPPSARAGECYARVWVPAAYETEQLQVKTKDASESIKLIDARYEWIDKQVLVKEASSRLEVIPAVYGQKSETRKISDERNLWLTGLKQNSPPANAELLVAAGASGINLKSAQPGMCYHEHYTPAEYKTINDTIVISEASTSVETIPADYKWVEEKVLVSAATKRTEEVPAVFETQTEEIIDVPAHTIWKKGSGPIQRINEATGEIMCLVEVPATYKTVTKRVLKQAATTRDIEVPAQYKTVKVRKKVSEPSEIVKEIPATYDKVSRRELVSPAKFIWHDVHDTSMDASSRTGSKICMVKEPAQYKTVSRKVVITPATTRRVDIPAEYETVKVKQLVSKATEERTAIPATYKTVTQRKVATEGHMEWRSILCETNMTKLRISQLQQSLQDKGYNPGPIDGIIGKQTIVAVNAFQKDNSLPVDRYLNLKTLDALGVSTK